MANKQLDVSLSERFIETTLAGDDKGVRIEGGQFSVGTPGDPKESVFGEGDSYAVGVNGSVGFHFDYADLSGTTITSATDITDELGSDESSAVGLFGGTTAGKAILIGSDYAFGGVKVKIDTLGVVEPTNVIAEYLEDNSPTWTTALYMATDANFPYNQYANCLGECASLSEQWRFGFDPTGTLPVPWDKVTLTINGTATEKYWALFRIETAITTDITLEQMKLHTNRHEVNSDGFTEYFGRARYAKTIDIIKTANATKNPANENITVGVGITEIRTDNEFNNGANDGLVLRGTVPEGLDTSIPIQVIIDWYAKGTGAGDVKIQLETLTTNIGFIYDGSVAPNAATPKVISISNQPEELQRTTFLVSPSASLPGDKIYGSLFRDANDVADTFAASIVIVDYSVVGYFWKP